MIKKLNLDREYFKMINITPEKMREIGVRVIDIERNAIETLSSQLDENFSRACEVLLKCPGRIVVIGMGKSSHIGGKIAATLSSIGSPAFFVHPGEASHGDMGMITPKDVVLAISYSGETPEILTLLPLIKHLKTPLIVLTGGLKSALASAADIVLNVSVKEEACPLGLAPTASSTAALVMGDALAVALLNARGFTAADFARSHPGGRLGKRLLLRVEDVMRTGKEMPIVFEHASLADALVEMTEKKMGVTMVVNTAGILSGIYTDGDLRRTLDKKLDIRKILIKDVMSSRPQCITQDKLAVEALQLMEDKQITFLAAADQTFTPIGALHIHDLLKAGVA